MIITEKAYYLLTTTSLIIFTEFDMKNVLYKYFCIKKWHINYLTLRMYIYQRCYEKHEKIKHDWKYSFPFTELNASIILHINVLCEYNYQFQTHMRASVCYILLEYIMKIIRKEWKTKKKLKNVITCQKNKRLSVETLHARKFRKLILDKIFLSIIYDIFVNMRDVFVWSSWCAMSCWHVLNKNICIWFKT